MWGRAQVCCFVETITRIMMFSPGKQFHCSECDYTCVSKPALLRHMEQHAEFKVRAHTPHSLPVRRYYITNITLHLTENMSGNTTFQPEEIMSCKSPWKKIFFCIPCLLMHSPLLFISQISKIYLVETGYLSVFPWLISFYHLSLRSDHLAHHHCQYSIQAHKSHLNRFYKSHRHNRFEKKNCWSGSSMFESL